MIVTSTRQTTKGKPGYLHKAGRASYAGYAYEGLKYTSKAFGFYQDIQPYLPETYLDRYRYKPRKRVAGYLGQAVYKSKDATSYNKLGKARGRRYSSSYSNKCGKNTGKSGYCS